MKTALVILALTFGAPVSSPALPGKGAGTEDLVQAAKDAKSKRKKPATKVLTNKDVKNSKGTLIVLPEAKGKAAQEKKAAGPSPLVQHDLNYRARLELQEALAEASEKVAALEKELALAESLYYEENDPDRRDGVIRKQFEETQQKLEEAKAELKELSPEPRAPSPDS